MNGRIRLIVPKGTLLILLELQGLGPSPNLIQDGTPTPPTSSPEITTKRPMLSSTAPTTPSLPSEIRKKNMVNSWNNNRSSIKIKLLQYKS